MFRFEKLDVWHKAIELTDRVYEATKAFPADERFGLTSQLRRAAVSIASNIAEGSSRTSDIDFLRFLEIAYGSLMEVVTQLHIACRQRFLPEQQHQALLSDAEQVARMLSGLKSAIQPNANK